MKSSVYAYAYNGKEKIGGTGLYAYGFRYYDPLTARFTGVDPISDQFAFVSVYNYAENSPIKHIDLHGLQAAKFMMIAKWLTDAAVSLQKSMNHNTEMAAQGASKSNPAINSMPLNQKSKDLLHDIQFNTRTAGLIADYSAPTRELLSLSPTGGSLNNVMNAGMEGQNGNYLSARISLLLIPVDLLPGGKSSGAKQPNGHYTIIQMKKD